MFSKSIENTSPKRQRVNESQSVHSLALRACKGVEYGAVQPRVCSKVAVTLRVTNCDSACGGKLSERETKKGGKQKLSLLSEPKTSSTIRGENVGKNELGQDDLQ
jgi:hypothetical protein